MLVRNFIFWLSTKRSVTDPIARRGMKYGFARRFVAGETLDEALSASMDLCSHGRHVSLNRLGENVTTEAAAREVCAGYIHMIEDLQAQNLDGNISIKLTQLGLDIDKELCRSMAREIAARASALGRTIEMDMEGSAYTDITLDIFESVQRELGNCGLAVQAYLYRSAEDLKRLAPIRAKIRLVKGAYHEPKNIAIQKKSDVDINFRKLSTQLLEGATQGSFFPAFGSHDPAMVAHAQAESARLKLAKGRYEFQMIYGIRRDLQNQVYAAGDTLQVYVPFGTDWCPYFMRRLSERPANCWFVLRSLLAESVQTTRQPAS
ncbi:MAG: proline dehydrogenase family protein [Candidatus Acidiferrum sp.]|jgi:proline dehydrogenase